MLRINSVNNCCNNVTVKGFFENVYNVEKTLFELINNLLRVFVRIYEKFVFTHRAKMMVQNVTETFLFHFHFCNCVHKNVHSQRTLFPQSNNLLLTKLTSLRMRECETR